MIISLVLTEIQSNKNGEESAIPKPTKISKSFISALKLIQAVKQTMMVFNSINTCNKLVLTVKKLFYPADNLHDSFRTFLCRLFPHVRSRLLTKFQHGNDACQCVVQGLHEFVVSK